MIAIEEGKVDVLHNNIIMVLNSNPKSSETKHNNEGCRMCISKILWTYTDTHTCIYHIRQGTGTQEVHIHTSKRI